MFKWIIIVLLALYVVGDGKDIRDLQQKVAQLEVSQNQH